MPINQRLIQRISTRICRMQSFVNVFREWSANWRPEGGQIPSGILNIDRPSHNIVDPSMSFLVVGNYISFDTLMMCVFHMEKVCLQICGIRYLNYSVDVSRSTIIRWYLVGPFLPGTHCSHGMCVVYACVWCIMLIMTIVLLMIMHT